MRIWKIFVAFSSLTKTVLSPYPRRDEKYEYFMQYLRCFSRKRRNLKQSKTTARSTLFHSNRTNQLPRSRRRQSTTPPRNQINRLSRSMKITRLPVSLILCTRLKGRYNNSPKTYPAFLLVPVLHQSKHLMMTSWGRVSVKRDLKLTLLTVKAALFLFFKDNLANIYFRIEIISFLITDQQKLCFLLKIMIKYDKG